MLNFSNIVNRREQIYATGLLATGLVHLGCCAYSKMVGSSEKSAEWERISLALTRLMAIPPFTLMMFKSWQHIAGNDPQASRVLKLFAGVFTGVFASAGMGVMFRLSGIRKLDSMGEAFAMITGSWFPVLNIAAISISVLKGRISKRQASGAISVCLALLLKDSLIRIFLNSPSQRQ